MRPRPSPSVVLIALLAAAVVACGPTGGDAAPDPSDTVGDDTDAADTEEADVDGTATLDLQIPANIAGGQLILLSGEADGEAVRLVVNSGGGESEDVTFEDEGDTVEVGDLTLTFVGRATDGAPMIGWDAP